jgi:tRNA G18 (ribose-2'-O)-methylase SpoU
MVKSGKNELSLVALDIEGDWNVPLLQNATDISGAFLRFAKGDDANHAASDLIKLIEPVQELLSKYDHVLACETANKSSSIYKYPSPRGNTALIVGNELKGVPRDLLSKVDQVVSIPMSGRGMSSVNVAVAGAIALYAFGRDLARKQIRSCTLGQKQVDIMLESPDDPNELGSLLRSAWAFGWRKVYVADRKWVWFTDDRNTVMAGRAAARREINPIVVAPDSEMNVKKYDRLIICTSDRSGTALSRFAMPDCKRPLIVYGHDEPDFQADVPIERVYVDCLNPKVTPAYRHVGSILLSVISQMLRKNRYGKKV